MSGYLPALSDEECQRLIVSLAAGMEVRGGFSEEQALELLRWAAQVRTDEALLNLALRGELVVSWRKGKPEFSALATLADGGRALRQALVRISEEHGE